MWTTIISTAVLALFIFAGRYLFIASDVAGDGGAFLAIMGYGCVLIAGIAAMVLTYKVATFGMF